MLCVSRYDSTSYHMPLNCTTKSFPPESHVLQTGTGKRGRAQRWQTGVSGKQNRVLQPQTSHMQNVVRNFSSNTTYYSVYFRFMEIGDL